MRSMARLLTVDNHGLAVVIEIAIMIAAFLDHHGVAIPMVTFANNFAIAITISVAMAGSDGDANRANAYADFFRAGRQRAANSSNCNSYNCKTSNHGLLSFVYELSEGQGTIERASPAALNGSGSGQLAITHAFIAAT